MASPPLSDSVLTSVSFSLGLGLVDPVAGLNSTGPLWLPPFTAAPGNAASPDGTALYQIPAELKSSTSSAFSPVGHRQSKKPWLRR